MTLIKMIGVVDEYWQLLHVQPKNILIPSNKKIAVVNQKLVPSKRKDYLNDGNPKVVEQVHGKG